MNKNHQEMQSKRQLEVMALLGIVMFFLVFSILNFRYLAVLSDGDIYSDMLVAREMWRQKTLFPSNWVFGNQYYVIATPVLAALFFGITGHMNLSMALATTVMGLLQVLCLAWMIYPAVPRRDYRLCALLLFMAAPMGFAILKQPQGQLFFALASYYACYTITLFFVLGDYIRARIEPEHKRPFALAVSLLLNFATGMQSLRQTAVMVLPLLTIDAFYFLMRLMKRKPLFPSKERFCILRTVFYAIANLAGCMVIQTLHVPSIGIFMNTAQSSDSFSQRLRALWVAIRGISGLDAAQFEEPRLFFVVFFVFQSLLILVAAIMFVRRLQQGIDAISLLWLFCVISICGVLLAGLLVELKMRNIYLFVWYLWVPLSLLMLLDTRGGSLLVQERSHDMVKQDAAQTVKAVSYTGQIRIDTISVLTVVSCVLCLGNLISSYGTSLEEASDTDISYKQDFIRDAEAAGISVVYGDWIFAPGYIALSDGALTGGFWGNTPLYVNEWINLQDIYSEEDNQHALYLVNGWEHDLFQYLVEEKGGTVTLFGEYGFCSAWLSDRQLMEFYIP